MAHNPDLLVLDEPGNHLDYVGLAWLEKFLITYRGAVLIVSHNRYLLDEVANQIIVKCRERGEQGKEILEGLIEYWESGTLEGKRSVELEEEGRRREVGDGKPQVRVRQRLERALRGL